MVVFCYCNLPTTVRSQHATLIWHIVELDGGLRRKSHKNNQSTSSRSHCNDFHFEILLHIKILSFAFAFCNSMRYASEPHDIDLEDVVQFCDQSSNWLTIVVQKTNVFRITSSTTFILIYGRILWTNFKTLSSCLVKYLHCRRLGGSSVDRIIHIRSYKRHPRL